MIVFPAVEIGVYPPNAIDRVAVGATTALHDSASNMDPGGFNVLFGVGSVHFLEDTIDTWAFDPSTGRPIGVTSNPDGSLSNVPKFGIWQSLSTRAGNEVVPGDAY